MALKQFLVLLAVIFSVMVGIYMIGAPLLGYLGGMAMDSEGSDGQGFSVSDETINDGAKVTFIYVPMGLITGVGVWAFISLLALLAYVGV